MDNLTAHKASEYDQKVRQTIPFYETIHAEVLRSFGRDLERRMRRVAFPEPSG